MTTLAITGAAGRMGRRLIALAAAEEGLRVAAALESKGCALLGKDAGTVAGIEPLGVTIAAELTGRADVLIDFSQPAGTAKWVPAAAAAGMAMVIGTTGLEAATQAAIEAAARHVAIVHAPNMSVGVNLVFRLAGQIAKALGADYDIEITETHHRFKADAPSGTAMGIARAICDALGVTPQDVLRHGREGQVGPRKRGEIGMHALRVGDVVGEHTITFGCLGERIEVKHVAHTRDTFVAGALRAAKWLAGKPAGLYSMQDVLL
jgi:4-hydroxy-tetrahydrodipicolinate reductase